MTRLVALGHLLACLLVACGVDGTMSLQPESFAVAYTSPGQEQVVASRSTDLIVVFTRSLDRTTIDNRSVLLISRFGDEVGGDIQVRPMTPTMVTFRPSSGLVAGMDYTLRIDADLVRDVDGASLDSAFELEFGVKGTPPAPPPTSGPGGGGGPGDPGSIVYAGTCDSMLGCVGNNWVFDPDGGSGGTLFDGFSGPMASRPSPNLHQGARVLLRLLEGTAKVASGKRSRVLTAVMPASGVEIPIRGHATPVYLSIVRWAADESFISYFEEEWAGSASTNLVKVPVSWDPDGQPAFGTPSSVLKFPGSFVVGTEHDWAPNGRDLIYSVDAKEVRVVVDGQESVIAHGSHLYRVHWVPGSNRVVYGDFSTTARTFHFVDPDGSNLQTLVLPNSGATATVLSPSGRELAFTSNRSTGGPGLFVIDIESREVRELTQANQTVVRPFGWVSLRDVR